MSQSTPGGSTTETADPRYVDMDVWSTGTILDALAESQMTAAAVVRAATPAMASIVEAALPRLQAGGRLFYVGAGTSGRIGMQDGVELTPTFGWPAERLILMLAGGREALFEAVEGAEDQEDVARAEILSHAPGEHDVVFGIAASGGTPYTCAALKAARERGALTVGISCNDGTRLLLEAERGLVLATGPEAVSGSTRLKAGTAQKMALNMMSTALMVRLGHIYRGMMVDMRVTNAKLSRRAVRMVRALAGGTDTDIENALAEAGGNVKRAVLIRKGFSLSEAELALKAQGGHLRAVLTGRR